MAFLHTDLLFSAALQTGECIRAGMPRRGRKRKKYAYNCSFSKFKLLNSKGPVAQSVEQRIENPCVGGSIPSQATRFKAPDQQ